MAPAKSPNDEATKDKDKQPASPRRASAARRPSNAAAATPANRRSSNAQTPKSAPAVPGAATGAGVRKTSPKKPIETTLLGDFLLGRPSAARQAASRRKSVDAAAVKQELRQQMKESAINRVPRPNGVQSRVKAWQKTNATAMAAGNPEDTPSEPTDVAAFDEKSVTEEDRVRIKYRQKPRRKSSPKASPLAKAATKEDVKPVQIPPKPTPVEVRQKSPPKKRIVSDDNWMKRNKAGAAPKATAPVKPNVPPMMQAKIKNWASKVEVPEVPVPPEIPRNTKPAKEYATKCGAKITVEEDASTVRSPRSREFITVEEDAPSSSRSWKTESARSGDDGIRVRPFKADSASPHVSGDETLRVKPTRKRQSVPVDDGIRVKPAKVSPLPDDGIRVRPIQDTARKMSGKRRDRTPTGRAVSKAESEANTATPTRRSKARAAPKMTQHATASAPTLTETSITRSDDEESWTSDESDSQADTGRPSSAPTKSLADIPFGNSAFSELDLPVGADHHHFKRPANIQRNSSFSVVPKAFRKIVTGAKEIVQERVDPPKPVVNQPPSIENWLSTTVDPFVEKPPPRRNSLEKEWQKDVRRRTSADHVQKKEQPPAAASPEPRKENEELSKEPQSKPVEPVLGPPIGLKRSKATRVNSSPVKQSTGKTPFREALNNLFRGESSGHKLSAKAYSSYQDTESDLATSYIDPVDDHVDYIDPGETHVRARNPHIRSLSPESASYVSTELNNDSEGPFMTPALPRRRPPPTNGHYELSTIVSGDSESTVGSETLSALSESTVTQTTGLTRSSAISRRRSGRPGPKRRLTKHSDLVSVLSLPDSEGPVRASSIKSRSSLRRRTSNLEKVTAEDLLEEFAIDEDLYRRELKTLVDGAVPVLLRQVVDRNDNYATDLFGAPSDGRGDALSKAVVSMGIALEKLKKLHKWAPLYDVSRILTWVQAAYPVYDKYLDVWRLGFEGIVVNLAPVPDRRDDVDSLVNAMPRNAYGDVVDTKGQPVDLQHLLTRPVARIRALLKLLRVSQCRTSGNLKTGMLILM